MLAILKSRQTLKVIIYSLLLINFVLYIFDDIRAASITMKDGGSILDWTQSFATTIDESAWLILLFYLSLKHISSQIRNGIYPSLIGPCISLELFVMSF